MPLSSSEFVKEIQQMVRRKHSGLLRVKMLNTPVLKISKSELPEPTETIVLAWGPPRGRFALRMLSER